MATYVNSVFIKSGLYSSAAEVLEKVNWYSFPIKDGARIAPENIPYNEAIQKTTISVGLLDNITVVCGSKITDKFLSGIDTGLLHAFKGCELLILSANDTSMTIFIIYVKNGEQVRCKYIHEGKLVKDHGKLLDAEVAHYSNLGIGPVIKEHAEYSTGECDIDVCLALIESFFDKMPDFDNFFLNLNIEKEFGVDRISELNAAFYSPEESFIKYVNVLQKHLPFKKVKAKKKNVLRDVISGEYSKTNDFIKFELIPTFTYGSAVWLRIELNVTFLQTIEDPRFKNFQDGISILIFDSGLANTNKQYEKKLQELDSYFTDQIIPLLEENSDLFFENFARRFTSKSYLQMLMNSSSSQIVKRPYVLNFKHTPTLFKIAETINLEEVRICKQLLWDYLIPFEAAYLSMTGAMKDSYLELLSACKTQ